LRVQKNQIFFGLGLTRAGNGFPEVSLLLPLCNELEITVNELLSGERVSEDYLKKAEENMVNLVREAQESKKKIILSAMAAGLTIIAAVPLFLLSGMLAMENWMNELGLVMNISELGANEEMLESIADVTFPMSGGYKELNRDEILRIFKESLQRKSHQEMSV
jgi:hypothetical protein